MGRKKNNVWVFIGVLLVILGLVNLARSFMEIEGATPFLYISFVLDCFALLLAAAYLLKGYGKNNVKLYRRFLIVYALACLVNAGSLTIVSYTYPILTFFLTMMQTYIFGVLMVLLYAKNLGENVSMGLSFSALVMMILLVAVTCFYISIHAGDPSAYDEILDLAASRYFALVYTMFICVKSKYVDKKDRGTL